MTTKSFSSSKCCNVISNVRTWPVQIPIMLIARCLTKNWMRNIRIQMIETEEATTTCLVIFGLINQPFNDLAITTALKMQDSSIQINSIISYGSAQLVWIYDCTSYKFLRLIRDFKMNHLQFIRQFLRTMPKFNLKFNRSWLIFQSIHY